MKHTTARGRWPAQTRTYIHEDIAVPGEALPAEGVGVHGMVAGFAAGDGEWFDAKERRGSRSLHEDCGGGGRRPCSLATRNERTRATHVVSSSTAYHERSHADPCMTPQALAHRRCAHSPVQPTQARRLLCAHRPPRAPGLAAASLPATTAHRRGNLLPAVRSLRSSSTESRSTKG
jgi:hypothetical protein